MLDAADVVALAGFVQIRRVDVAIEGDDAVGLGVDGGVADERTAHEVAVDIPKASHFTPEPTLEPEHAEIRGEGVRSGHVGAVGGSGDQRRKFVAGLDERLGRERFGTFVGVGVDEEALAGGGVFVTGPEEVVGLLGQHVALRDADLHAEEFADGGFDAGVVERGIGVDVPVAFGLFEDVQQVVAVFGEVSDHGVVIGALERDDDLGFGGDVILHGGRGLLERRVDDHLEDVAVVGNHVLETAFGDAQHVEQGFVLVQVGYRCGEDGSQRVAELSVPLHLRAYDDEFVGAALGSLFLAQRIEGVTSHHRQQDHDDPHSLKKAFHNRLQ